jgi:acetyl esterase
MADENRSWNGFRTEYHGSNSLKKDKIVKKNLFLVFFCMAIFIIAKEAFAESFWEMGPEKVREMFNKRALSIKAETPEVWKVENLTIKNDNRTTPLRIYLPSDQKDLPIILYIHGGAWVGGNLDTYDNLARYLCRGVRALVVSVGYLNSPEGKFPLPLEQCYDALLWIVKNAQEFKTDSSRLAVVGDSAGGGMAAALCLLDRDRKGPYIDFQVLINPVVDNTWGGALQPQGDEYDSERWVVSQYVTNPKETYSPYVSPIYAKDLSNLPQAIVILAEKDMFRKAGQEYADSLRAAGVHTNVYTQFGIGHLAGNGGRASILAQESLDVAVAALRGAFRKPINDNG